MVNEEAERWRRRYEREREARRSAEQLAADTLHRLHLQLEAAQSATPRSLQEQKSDFLTVVSHELRTPLTILRGGLHVLERRAQAVEPTMSQVLGTVTRAADRLVRIVQNVEISARLRDHEHQWGLAEVDLAQLVRQVVLETAPDDGVQVDIPEGTAVLVSQALLRAVMANLVQNAVMYGRAPFEVWARTEGPFVEIRVVDRGPGLPEGRADLFADFAQGDIGDRRTSRGLGLGLSIVVGGAVRGGWHVAHERADGSTFVVRVPSATATRLDQVQVVEVEGMQDDVRES